MAEIMKI